MTGIQKAAPVLARVFFALLNLIMGFSLLVGLFSDDYHLAWEGLGTFVFTGAVMVPLGVLLLLKPRER
jgi:hypothetical protein